MPEGEGTESTGQGSPVGLWPGAVGVHHPKEWERPGFGDVVQEAQGGWEGLLCYTNEVRRGLKGLEKGDHLVVLIKRD